MILIFTPKKLIILIEKVGFYGIFIDRHYFFIFMTLFAINVKITEKLAKNVKMAMFYITSNVNLNLVQKEQKILAEFVLIAQFQIVKNVKYQLKIAIFV